MKSFEVTFIVDPVLSGDEIKEAAKNYVELVKKRGGKVVSIDEMGLRKLAYPINERESGYYYNIEFQTQDDAPIITDIEMSFKRDGSILRFLTVRLDKYGVKYNEDKRSGKIKRKKKTEENIEEEPKENRKEIFEIEHEDTDLLVLANKFIKTKVSRTKVEIKIADKSLKDFNEEEEENLLTKLREVLGSKEILIINKREGSVILTLELKKDEAEKLFLLIKTGGLEELGITDAKLKHFEETISSVSDKTIDIEEEKGNIDNIRIILKNLLITYDLDFVAKKLISVLKTGTEKQNDVIALLSRVKRLNRKSVNGAIDDDAESRQYNNIVFSIIKLIDSIEPQHIAQGKMQELIK